MLKPSLSLFFLAAFLPFQGAQAATLRIATGQEIESLDPAFVDGGEAVLVATSLFEGLVVLDPKTAHAVAGVAQSWKISPDQKMITFALRKEAKWSDSKPVTAEHFFYAWKRALTPATGAYYSSLFDIIENVDSYRKGTLKDFSKVGIRVVSPSVLEVRLKNPTAYALDVLTHPVFFPLRRELVEAKEGKTAWLKPEKLVTNGPFSLGEWKHKQLLKLKKSESYFDSASVSLNEVEIQPIESFKTALQMYEAGQIDWLRRVPPHLVSSLKDRPDFHTGPLLSTVYLRFNTKGQAFSSAKLRAALSLAIDRKILAEKVAKEGQIPATGFTPPGIFNSPREDLVGFKLEEAKKLLAEYKAGLGGKAIGPVELLYISDEQSEKVAMAVSVMLKKNLDLSVSPRNLERGVFYSTLDSMKHDLARSSTTANYFDPMSFLEKFTGSNTLNNLTGFAEPRYDALIAAASAETDSKKRELKLKEAEKILVEEFAAIVPLYHNPSLGMWKKNVSGLYVNALDSHPLKAIKVIGLESGVR